MRRYIAEGLQRYIDEEYKPWHMPGHKRRPADKENCLTDGIDSMLSAVMSCDVTEVKGVDDLHHPSGMIKQSLDELARVYGTYRSYYLINGSTSGIMAAITACCQGEEKKDGRILIAKNCHRSVLNTAKLLRLKTIDIDVPGINDDIYGSVPPASVEEVCRQNPDACAVVVTSPTYEGIISDIKGISEVTSRYNIPLIVDEAHGAHLPFIKRTGTSAIYRGADIVIQSLHKTLPAMTQTALLHLTNDKFDEQIKKYLSVYMSTSPSYPMLCSMEYAVWRADMEKHEEYLDRLCGFRELAKKYKHMKLLDAYPEYGDRIYEFDITRLVFITEDKRVSGEKLSDMLSWYGKVVCEMSGLRHIVLISTICDSIKAFEQLHATLTYIDDNWDILCDKVIKDKSFDTVELKGLICSRASEDIYVYPPGIPIVKAGDIITPDAVSLMERYAAMGREIYGIS